MSKKICKNFYLITNYNNHIPQKIHETESLDIKKMVNNLANHFNPILLNLDQITDLLVNENKEFHESYFFFCSSQIESYKYVILDTMFEVQQRGGILIPKFDFYIAHENKFYQEMYKKRKKIQTPRSYLFSTYNGELSFNQDTPCVIKKYSGFGSKTVTLAQKKNDFSKQISKMMEKTETINSGAIPYIKSWINNKLRYKGLYPKRIGRVVAQEFIPNLKYDWKVLVFGHKVFALKRYIKKNDFRASGSGSFDFNDIPPDSLIWFAIDVRKKLETPFVSLDIAQTIADDYMIIEYQSVHFGLSTLINAKRYFFASHDKVIVHEIDEPVEVESLFVESLINYCKV